MILLAAHTVLQFTDKTLTSPKLTGSMSTSTLQESTQILDAIVIEPIEPPAVFSRSREETRPNSDTPKATPIPQELKGVTDDPAVADFLKKYDPRYQELGEVKDSSSHTQQLLVNGKAVFEASQILRRRTMALDGTIVLAAIIEASNVPANKTDIATKPSSIWMIDPRGIKRQVSPQSVNASTPLISPDGKRVAFTGVSIGPDGREQEPLLWVYDLATKQYRKFAPSQKGHNYSLGAAEWSQDGQVLHVIEDHGETRGHMVMRTIKL